MFFPKTSQQFYNCSRPTRPSIKHLNVDLPGPWNLGIVKDDVLFGLGESSGSMLVFRAVKGFYKGISPEETYAKVDT